MGCTWLAPIFSPQDVYDVLGNSWVRCSACALVLFGEIAVILFLLSRRLCIAGLVACQLLHLVFALMCGTYFSHWFFINLIFIFVFSRTSFEQIRKQWTFHHRLAITAVAVVLCPLIFHTSVLAWSTERSMEIFTWHASPLRTSETLKQSALVSEPQIDPNRLFPYEKNFQMSWRFERLINELEQRSAAPPKHDGRSLVNCFASVGEWYKLRMVGEWHERLPRRMTKDTLDRDLRHLMAKFHERQLQDRNMLLPAYYTHMAYNPRLIPEHSALQPEAINSYVLVRQKLAEDHGSVYLTQLPEDLCRVGVR
jgi:hypothetical protein